MTSNTLTLPWLSSLNSLLEQKSRPSLEMAQADRAAKDRMLVAIEMAEMLDIAVGVLEKGCPIRAASKQHMSKKQMPMTRAPARARTQFRFKVTESSRGT
jgi:hypothetical protein